MSPTVRSWRVLAGRSVLGLGGLRSTSPGVNRQLGLPVGTLLGAHTRHEGSGRTPRKSGTTKRTSACARWLLAPTLVT